MSSTTESYLSRVTPEERKLNIEEGKKRWDAIVAKFISENNDQLKNYFRGVPKAMQRGWLDSFLAKNSAKKAIKAKCYDCSGYARSEASNCAVRTCPLWQYRPGHKQN